ncbi:DUF1242-domain-containing protein [Aspergillus terreus]|uniref:Protein kish n=1 Tax=Aspergillus terreus TaxID=33178 RepID=A0A5M3Z940_ASPTE|nr:hypothetical protein ATETN484_0012007500 [Aspergillus terreus]GFF19323.1 DUF1242-domain-containing protein [Aspergillus terreus]
MSALFNFQSLLLVFLLIICTSTYAHSIMPGIMDRNQHGYVYIPDQSSNVLINDSFFGIFWKCARIGERLSPYVSICCILMAVSIFGS